MSESAITLFLSGLPRDTAPIAARIAEAVSSSADLDAAVKWKQLTFACDGDFDHWICAVSATTRSAALVIHFGSLLNRDEFDPSEAKFTRRVTYRAVDEVNDRLIAELVTLAIEALPTFRARVTRR